MEEGLLYVVFNEWIRNPETQEMPYKIGITKYSVSHRYYGLGLKMPGKFETKFAYKLKNYAEAEKALGIIFNENKINGEWYDLSENDLTLIESNCKKMQGELITDEIEKEIKMEETEMEEIENEIKKETGEPTGNNLENYDIFNEIVKYYNENYIYKTVQNDDEKKWRRIKIEGRNLTFHFEFFFSKEKPYICIALHDEKNINGKTPFENELRNLDGKIIINGYTAVFKKPGNWCNLSFEISYSKGKEFISECMDKYIKEYYKVRHHFA
jgi:hypothetical protein